MIKTFTLIGDGDISDGYHTFGQLYDHRCLIYLNLCLANQSQCRWRHDSSTPGWFILYWESPAGQISYHLPDKLRKYVQDTFKYIDHDVFDGHTSQDVLHRLEKNLENKIYRERGWEVK